MLKNPRDGIDHDDVAGQIAGLKAKGFPLAYVGDVVGTGSSRKSATNSVLWYMGDDVPCVPNKRAGGVCIGGKIAPIFFNTMEDAGSLPIEMDVTGMAMGDVIDVFPFEGVAKRHGTDEVLAEFALKTNVIPDEVRAGGRIPLIIGRGLTGKARAALGLEATTTFAVPDAGGAAPKGYSLAQKMVGKACGVDGVAPGVYSYFRDFRCYVDAAIVAPDTAAFVNAFMKKLRAHDGILATIKRTGPPASWRAWLPAFVARWLGLA